jgi:hypothetical protein
MYANAHLSAQIGKIREVLPPLLEAVNALGGGPATYARVDAGDRAILLELARDLEDAVEALREMAREARTDE